jgi:hypothetical protein
MFARADLALVLAHADVGDADEQMVQLGPGERVAGLFRLFVELQERKIQLNARGWLDH